MSELIYEYKNKKVNKNKINNIIECDIIINGFIMKSIINTSNYKGEITWNKEE